MFIIVKTNSDEVKLAIKKALALKEGCELNDIVIKLSGRYFFVSAKLSHSRTYIHPYSGSDGILLRILRQSHNNNLIANFIESISKSSVLKPKIANRLLDKSSSTNRSKLRKKYAKVRIGTERKSDVLICTKKNTAHTPLSSKTGKLHSSFACRLPGDITDHDPDDKK